MDSQHDPAASGRAGDARQPIVVVGLGYVGLPVALAFARSGFRTTGFDVDGTRVRALSNRIDATREVGAAEGLFVAPEGAACFVALGKLRSAGTIGASDRVVIFNTGSGIKYLDCYKA